MAVVVAIAIGYVQPVKAYLDAREEVRKREAQKAALLRRQAVLDRRLRQAETDAFLEREARKLNLVRPGERLYVVRGVERWREAARVP